MSEGSENKKVIIKDIEYKIWEIFSILKNENVRTDDYYVALLFLSIYRDRLITKRILFEKEIVKETLFADHSNENTVKSNQYNSINESYNKTLLQISDRSICRILTILFEIDHKFLSQHFPEIFDKKLIKITQSHGRYAGEFIQPVEIWQFFVQFQNYTKMPKFITHLQDWLLLEFNLAKMLITLNNAAKLTFGYLLEGKTLNGQQIRFLDTVINFFTVKGVIEPSMLFESPFTDISESGIMGVFDEVISVEIISLISDINKTAEAA